MASVVLFVLVALALVAAALAFVLPTLLRGRSRAEAESRAADDAEIYRRQIDELDQEVACGDLSADDATAAQQELRRQRMNDTRPSPATTTSRSRSRRVALALAVALPLVASALYLAVGKPDALTDEEGAPPPAAAPQADYVEQLQRHLERQPRDGRGWVLLARAQADREEFGAAADAYGKAITVSTKIAKDPGVLCEYADALGMTQGGSLAGKPAELVAQALALDPLHPLALEMAGSAAYAEGRYAEAVRHWTRLLEQLAPGSERHTELTAAVERARRRASVTLPR